MKRADSRIVAFVVLMGTAYLALAGMLLVGCRQRHQPAPVADQPDGPISGPELQRREEIPPVEVFGRKWYYHAPYRPTKFLSLYAATEYRADEMRRLIVLNGSSTCSVDTMLWTEERFGQDWLKSGTEIILFRDGRKEQAEYRHGKLNGQRNAWHANGTLKLDELYIDGKLDGTSRMWSEDGKLEYEAVTVRNVEFPIYEGGQPLAREVNQPTHSGTDFPVSLTILNPARGKLADADFEILSGEVTIHWSSGKGDAARVAVFDSSNRQVLGFDAEDLGSKTFTVQPGKYHLTVWAGSLGGVDLQVTEMQ